MDADRSPIGSDGADPRLQQASEWLLKLRDGEPEPGQAAAWLEWTRRDPANLAAFEHVRELMRGLDEMSQEQKSAIVRELLPRPQDVGPPHRFRIPPRGRIYLALAASVVCAAVLVGYYFACMPSPASATTTRFVTTSHNRQFTLPDGTDVELAAHSQINVTYTPGRRRVALIDGEAFFAVRHNARRPFIVHAGELRLMDIGTTFDVRKNDGYVTVAVAEGEVAVTPPQHDAPAVAQVASASANRPELSLKAGQQLVADASQCQLTTSEIDASNVASWRSGRLYFRNTPLSVVIANVNRYAPYRIVVADPRVDGMRFTGMVSVEHIGEWLAAAREVFSLREEHGPGGRVLLYSDTSR